MTTVGGIEKAVAKLPPNELAAFRTWFEALDAQRLDKAIERGAGSGKLDKLADEALAAHRAGRTREIGEMRQARHSGRPPIGCRKPCALADRSYALLKADPRHPSLHFKRVGRYWSVRVGLRYRAPAVESDDALVWFWIGSHAQHDALIDS